MEETPEREINLLDYWAIVQRRRWVVYLAVGTVTLVALVGSYLVTPLYRATVTLQIERHGPDILTFQDLARVDHSWSAYKDFYQTQYKILSSDAVTRLAARRLDLSSHPLFQERRSRPSLLGWLRAMTPGAGGKAALPKEDIATGWVRSGLEISPVRDSHLVRVSWVSPDPELASRVANEVVDSYIHFNIESQYTPSDQAVEFLVNQVGTLKKELAAIEERLQQYGQSKQIVSIDDSSNITLKALSDIAQRRTQAQTRLAEKEAAYRAVLESSPDALSEVLHSALIARLKEEYAAYEVEYSEKARQFKDDWPGMKTLRSKLEQSRERLEIETQEIARKVTAAAEADHQKALREVRNLDSLLHKQETAAQLLKRDAFQYATLQAEAQRKRETLNTLLARQNEMALSTRLKDLDVTSSNIRVVDRARPPRAAFRPDKKLNLLLGFVLGLGLGVAMAFFLDYLDNTISSPAQIETVAKLPTLAVIPRHGVSPSLPWRVRRRHGTTVPGPVELVAHRDGRASASEAYHELRTSILLSNPGHPPHQILISSPLSEEGKSATAINLAVVLAQLGRRVLLVDTDLRRPRLHKVFEVSNRCGVSTYLSGLEEDPGRLVVGTALENLDLIPSGLIPPNPSELLNSPLLAAMGSHFLEAGYDHIVYDSPPTLSVSDPVIIASVVRTTILVVRADRTPRESLRLATEKLSQAGTRPVGAVINDLDLESRGYSRYAYYGRYAYRGETPEEHLPEEPERDRAGGAGSA